MGFFTVYQAYTQQNLTISMQKKLAKEFGRGNIRLSIRFCGIFSIYEFDMGDPVLIKAF